MRGFALLTQADPRGGWAHQWRIQRHPRSIFENKDGGGV